MTPNGALSRTTYAGGGGVGVGGFFHKLMYGIKFGDANFLLSSRVGPHSKVLYYRDPAERVEKVAPWLTLDGDPYPVVADGRILWVVDGYTTTNQYPQSERDSFSDMTSDAKRSHDVSPEAVAKLIATLNERGYWPTPMKAVSNPYIGPGAKEIAPGEYRRGSVVDLAPTVLYYMGLPIGRDMDGFARTDMFRSTFTREHPVTYTLTHER